MAVIICCVLFAAILAKNYVLSSIKQGARNNPRAQSSLVGKTLSIANIDWSKNQQTLILVLQKGCQFCDESVPFYRRLLTKELSSPTKTHLVAIFPHNNDESKQYLKDKMIEIADVRQASLKSVGVQGTPTLVLVDNTGTVLEQWVGKLPATQEDAVLSRLEP